MSQEKSELEELKNKEMPAWAVALVMLGCVFLFFAWPASAFCHIPLAATMLIGLIVFLIPCIGIVAHNTWKHLAEDEKQTGERYVPPDVSEGTIFAACLSPTEQFAYKAVISYLPAFGVVAGILALTQIFNYQNPVRLFSAAMLMFCAATWAFTLGKHLAWRIDVRFDGLLVYTARAKTFYSWADLMFLKEEKMKSIDYDKKYEDNPNIYSITLFNGSKFSFLRAFERRFGLASFIAKNAFNAAKQGLDPTKSSQMIKEASVCFNRKDYQQAAELFTKALAEDQFSEAALFARGISYFMMKHSDKAIHDMSKFVELNDGVPYAYFIRGSSYEALEKYREARDDYGKAYALGFADPWLEKRIDACDFELKDN